MKYRDLILHTKNNNLSERDQLCNAAMGLAGESGEVLDCLKKHLFHGHPLDKDKVLNELGDVRYYLEWMLSLLSSDIKTIEEKNTAKLMVRYPQGFSTQSSIRRVDVKK